MIRPYSNKLGDRLTRNKGLRGGTLDFIGTKTIKMRFSTVISPSQLARLVFDTQTYDYDVLLNLLVQPKLNTIPIEE